MGRGESREEPLEVARAGDSVTGLVGQHRLRGAGRTDDQHVLSREERRERAVDQLGALEERLLELFPNRTQRLARGDAFANFTADCVIENVGAIEAAAAALMSAIAEHDPENQQDQNPADVDQNLDRREIFRLQK